MVGLGVRRLLEDVQPDSCRARVEGLSAGTGETISRIGSSSRGPRCSRGCCAALRPCRRSVGRYGRGGGPCARRSCSPDEFCTRCGPATSLSPSGSASSGARSGANVDFPLAGGPDTMTNTASRLRHLVALVGPYPAHLAGDTWRRHGHPWTRCSGTVPADSPVALEGSEPSGQRPDDRVVE